MSEELASYYEDLEDFMESTFGFSAYSTSKGGLRLVVKTVVGPALIVVPRKNHYVVL